MRLLSLLALLLSRTRFGVVVAAGLLSATCDKMPLLAPTNSTITLIVSTTVVPVNGTATITASVTESAGTPVQNGTVVTFTASFGRVEPAEARTTNGKANVQFIAGSQSGTARITAFSGSTSAATTADNDIKVGGAAAARILGRADPPSVPAAGGASTIIATVLDAVGNPLTGVPVTFTSDAGTVSPGQSVTDGIGEARTSLTTPRTAKVTATAGNQSVDVTVNAQTPSVTIVPPTTAIEVGIPAVFTIRPPAASATTNPIRSVVLNWGDGSALENLGPITGDTPAAHTFRNPGTYRITATVTDTQGIVGESSISVAVNSQSAISVNLTASPNPVSVASNQGLVNFTATVGGGLGGNPAVQSYYWVFGDASSPQVTTGNTINHRYNAPGNYIATVEVVTTNGQRGFSQVEIRVTP
jgi:adhesin/invasin